MEMPKGWKLLCDDYNKIMEYCHEKTKDTHLGSCSPVGCLCCYHEVIALNLLKEMAEVIDGLTKANIQMIGGVAGVNETRDVLMRTLEVLSRFKEWK
jgi:hypothetical protein